jgi:hypothetical protein
VGGLSHYIEAEGIATAGISLIREHTERIKPPRALWVPFELGRPFGPPNHPEFQKDVLRSLLALFSREAGPILEDYPHESPLTEEADEAWSCVLPLPPLETAGSPAEAVRQTLLQEVGNLAPWYAESVRRRGRSTFGLSGASVDQMDEIANFLARLAAGEDPSPPQGLTEPMPQALRFMVDDVKAYYMEAANEQPGPAAPGGVRMWRWFYHETRMGRVLYDLRDRLVAEHAARTAANGGTPPPGPPPPNMISARFAQRPAFGDS